MHALRTCVCQQLHCIGIHVVASCVCYIIIMYEVGKGREREGDKEGGRERGRE